MRLRYRILLINLATGLVYAWWLLVYDPFDAAIEVAVVQLTVNTLTAVVLLCVRLAGRKEVTEWLVGFALSALLGAVSFVGAFILVFAALSGISF